MTVQKSENRTEAGQNRTAKLARLPKTHQDYWPSRLRKRSYESDGAIVEIPTWQVRLTHLGKESWFNLDTPNKTAAAVKARDIYVFLIANGWAGTLAKFKPRPEAANGTGTVGEFLSQVKAVSGLKPGTFEIYAKKFRSLVAGVFKLRGGKDKFDYVHGGREKWLNRVHAVRLNKLTPAKINSWRVNYLKAASGNPVRLKRAHTTVNSVLRAGKSLFSPKILKLLSLSLPTPLPFEGVENSKVFKSRYQSEINPALLIQQARRELADAKGDDAEEKREMFKIILLALGAGLRRDEIDTLLWRNVLWARNIIRVETTEHGGTKSAESQADVDVDPALLTLLKTFLPAPGKGSPFVIGSPVRPKPHALSYHHYRCERLFQKVIEWLRGKGVTARNALHSLRKEFGSQVCAQGGIYAASRALRHASIQITSDTYTDNRKPVVFPMAEMLIEKAEAQPASKTP